MSLHWFSERQLRLVHDAAVRVAGKLAPMRQSSGRHGALADQRLAERMERRFIDFADIIPADDAVRSAASSAAPASAVALLAAAGSDERNRFARTRYFGTEAPENGHETSYSRGHASVAWRPPLRLRRKTARPLSTLLPYLPHDEGRRQPAWA